MKDLLRYDKMVEAALRGVVREVLARTAANGRPGEHHFYITFRTTFPGVVLPPSLREEYPDEMTIVLEHQFWDLEVREDGFAVTLSFRNKSERLGIPFEAVTGFADPSVKFGLQFQAGPEEEMPAAPAPREPGLPVVKKDKPAEVVTLDKFRKK